MDFNVDLLERRRDELNELGVRVVFMGDLRDERIPPILLERIRDAEALTEANRRMTMVFAFNYGGRVEIVDAVRSISAEVEAGTLRPSDIDVETIASHLYVPEMPDPDLVIRTSGEHRTSNYLLWEAAYSEYVFTDVLWPDFDRAELARCIVEYQGRDRRFGGAIDASLDGSGR